MSCPSHTYTQPQTQKSTVLCLLQNQWFKDPVKAQAIYDKDGRDVKEHAWLNAAYLFMGSLTGRRIKQAFPDHYEDFEYWEASPHKAGKSDGCFPPDRAHILRAVRFFEPRVILCFGRVAAEGIRLIEHDACELHYVVIHGPHPAARHATVMDELRRMNQSLKGLLK